MNNIFENKIISIGIEIRAANVNLYPPHTSIKSIANPSNRSNRATIDSKCHAQVF